MSRAMLNLAGVATVATIKKFLNLGFNPSQTRALNVRIGSFASVAAPSALVRSTPDHCPADVRHKPARWAQRVLTQRSKSTAIRSELQAGRSIGGAIRSQR